MQVHLFTEQEAAYYFEIRMLELLARRRTLRLTRLAERGSRRVLRHTWTGRKARRAVAVSVAEVGSMALGDCWKQLSWFYYQYLLVTALYMLEPWERTLFNSLLISVAGMAVYTGYVFMPQHIMAILHYFEVVQ
ncbi:serine palmitoyltransferase small subunit A [Pungitius pungitius]|uniref:serine palmitoyltransferase small subunit A n=1 Tax=Pungitius pungitius TaxID=134920 RepID=UPI002E10834E